MRTPPQKEYRSPVVVCTAEPMLEPILAGPSTSYDYFEPLFVIEGQEIDGYYDNEDIINAWE